MGSTLIKIIAVLGLILHFAFVLIWAVAGSLSYISYIYGPTLQFPHSLGKSSLGNCGPSADELEDLILDENITEENAKASSREHGFSVIPNVLRNETAQKLRDYAMKANKELDQVYVINPDHRYHIMPPHTEPTLQAAFKEIAQHPVLRPLLDNLMGPKASILSCSIVTSEYGAKEQVFHPDAGTSVVNYPDLFVPEYTVAIPLQDTTADMGATGVCPGTHLCSSKPDYDWDQMEEEFWKRRDLVAKFGDFDTYSEYNLPCEIIAELNQGDGILYSSDVLHRGRAHTDPDALERAQLFIIFAGSRNGPDDKRSLPMGQVYVMDWRMMGQTVEDMASMDSRPWRIWHVFGLWNGKGSVRPWNWLDNFFRIFTDEDEEVYTFFDHSKTFDAEDFWQLADSAVEWAWVATIVYLVFALPLWMLLVILAANTHLQQQSGTERSRKETRSSTPGNEKHLKTL